VQEKNSDENPGGDFIDHLFLKLQTKGMRADIFI
jgi:hypothetical protein